MWKKCCWDKHGRLNGAKAGRSRLHGDLIDSLPDIVRRHPGMDQYSNELDLLFSTSDGF